MIPAFAGVPAGMRVLSATRPVDFRRGADGSAAMVQAVLRQDPFLCVAGEYVAARFRSVPFGGDAGLCRHMIYGSIRVLPQFEIGTMSCVS